MRVVVTDTGFIWNHENPILKEFGKDAVLVVCLNGKKVTKKYQCFVSPYQPEVKLGMDKWGTESQKYRALESVEDNLYAKVVWSGDPDILFLTDGNPESLYPFFVLKDRKEEYKIHLCAMSPWRFESKQRIEAYKALISDLSQLSSILYIDSDILFEKLKKKTRVWDEFLKLAEEEYVSLLPRVVRSITKLKEPSYFDFASMSYVPIKNGMKEIDLSKAEIESPSVEVLNSTVLEYTILGYPWKEIYPQNDDRTKAEVEKPIARIDGKRICTYLRELRIKLAQANGIEFSSEECPSIGPCAGTCAKCDAEEEYLSKKLSEIPLEKQVIPYDLLTEWEVKE
ncbi:membrane receptor RagA [Brotaphodocola sp.]|uniref:membrane receptor RagA n=1 Tax=Brotaphodocola sp. TaxID=3073577 RepID=UPI003D7CC9E4